MKKLIVFHPALAPYRVDFFNSLADVYDSKFYFTNDNLQDQKFNQKELRSQCKFKFNLLNRGFKIGGRFVRFGISDIIKKEKPQIVICSEYSQITLVVLVLKFFSKQTFKVYTISDDSVDISAKRKGLRKYVRNIVSYLIDGIILPSELVCNHFHEHINSKTPLFTLPIIHDNCLFRNKLEAVLFNANNEVDKFKLKNKKIFLFVGRLVKIKNAHFLLKSYAASLENTNNTVLIVIGEGDEEKNLKRLASKLNITNKCLFLGRLEGPELFKWYHIADCLILPSYQEPYGVVVNEALLAGCKVLCSNMAGASELINHKNGSVFDPFDEMELTNLIINLSKNIDVNRQKLALREDLMPFELQTKIKNLISSL